MMLFLFNVQLRNKYDDDDDMQLFSFRDGHVTTFRHLSAYICQMPGHRLSRLAKVTLSGFGLSIGTIGLG